MVSLSKVQRPVYVVLRGRGVDTRSPVKLVSWSECQKLIAGFPAAEYKKCANEAEASRYIEQHLARILEGGNDKANEGISPRNISPPMGLHERTVIYTDGSSIPPSKRGKGGAGYGIVVLKNGEKMECGGKVPCFTGNDIPTNNQAELYAICVAIENCTGPLLIRTDSEYSINCLTKWHVAWQRNGWKNSKGEEVANGPFIQYILRQLSERDVLFEHVRGHSGDEDNERCDELAKSAALE